jgi:hypothetical protein
MTFVVGGFVAERGVSAESLMIGRLLATHFVRHPSRTRSLLGLLAEAGHDVVGGERGARQRKHGQVHADAQDREELAAAGLE